MTEKKPKRKVERRSVMKVINVQPPRPSDDLFNPFAEAKAAEAPTTHHLPPTTYLPPATPIAPERDFVRVPNSVVRDALPSGLFKGESKKTYDALYQRTRGAVVPRRMLRATLSEVMAWADVSHNTLKAHLKHLARVGLVRVHYVRGDNTGAEYEVLTPEEAPPTTHQPQTTHQLATSQNLAPPTSQNLVLGGGGQTVDFKELPGSPKTKINTSTLDDDEPMPLLRSRVGKPMPKTEAVLLALLDTLEARTGGDISSHDALLAHVLTRKLQPRSNAAQRRPTDETFTPPPVTEYSEEELTELRKIEAEIRAELKGR
jgi:hypothetical protein